MRRASGFTENLAKAAKPISSEEVTLYSMKASQSYNPLIKLPEDTLYTTLIQIISAVFRPKFGPGYLSHWAAQELKDTEYTFMECVKFYSSFGLVFGLGIAGILCQVGFILGFLRTQDVISSSTLGQKVCFFNWIKNDHVLACSGAYNSNASFACPLRNTSIVKNSYPNLPSTDHWSPALVFCILYPSLIVYTTVLASDVLETVSMFFYLLSAKFILPLGKLVCFIVVVIPKILIALFLWYWGSKWLLNEQEDVKYLIIHSIAFLFIKDIDENFHFLAKQARVCHPCLHWLQYMYSRKETDLRRTTTFGSNDTITGYIVSRSLQLLQICFLLSGIVAPLVLFRLFCSDWPINYGATPYTYGYQVISKNNSDVSFFL